MAMLFRLRTYPVAFCKLVTLVMGMVVGFAGLGDRMSCADVLNSCSLVRADPLVFLQRYGCEVDGVAVVEVQRLFSGICCRCCGTLRRWAIFVYA